MRLTDGLNTTIMRWLKWPQSIGDAAIGARTYNTLAWRPGNIPGGEGWEMWAAHGKERTIQSYMEKLSREAA